MASKLQKELQQTKPFASAEEEAHLNLVRTAELLWQGISDTLKPAELTPTQYNALRILRGAEPEGATCSQISERMVTKDSDITRLLDRLEARQLIMRERNEQDRRIIVTRITQEGLRLLADLEKPIAEYHRRMFGHLGEKRLATLNKLLEDVRDPAS